LFRRWLGRVYEVSALRCYSVLIFAALVCTLGAKLFHSLRMDMPRQYLSWIPADIATLVGLEVILALLCYWRPRRYMIRTATIIAAIICTWSVLNAGWLIRTGTQILPTVLTPLFREPLNVLSIVAETLIKCPVAAVVLLAPSTALVIFFLSVIWKTPKPDYRGRTFSVRICICVLIVVASLVAQSMATEPAGSRMISSQLRYNCQMRAVTSLLVQHEGSLSEQDFRNARRHIPFADEINLSEVSRSDPKSYNVVVIVLEGVQRAYTSLGDESRHSTPKLKQLAAEGLEFTRMRSSVTHTTKALFSLFTGRYPSIYQDLAETVPTPQPYASLATILEKNKDYRTAFFQSAKGNFESRPAMVNNLGFDNFYAREDLADPNQFLGYLGCDEFALLDDITKWIDKSQKPFMAAIMCSVTHDPYEIPQWYGEPAKKPPVRYEQTIRYTDKFLSALDERLAELGVKENTILCVIGDHGEAFGEHGLHGHERIGFEEALRVPWVLRARGLIEAGSKVNAPVSSVDLCPTILGLLGYRVENGNFDGVNAAAPVPSDRKVYFFGGWMEESPAGYIQGHKKYICYYPEKKAVMVYDLDEDPLEKRGKQVDDHQGESITKAILNWRRNSIFQIEQQRSGEKVIFENWLCNWKDRVCVTRYEPQQND